MDTDTDTQTEREAPKTAARAPVSSQPRDDVREPTAADDVPDRLPPAVAEVAAGGQRLDAEVVADATEWFLSEDPDEEQGEVPTNVLEINVSTTRTPKWVPWRIRALDADELRAIQRQSSGNRRERRTGGEPDEQKNNLLIVCAATVDPDLVAISLGKGVQDATHTLKHRFRNKPGLINQIAAEVLLYSGFDSDDVRDAREVRAAGN